MLLKPHLGLLDKIKIKKLLKPHLSLLDKRIVKKINKIKNAEEREKIRAEIYNEKVWELLDSGMKGVEIHVIGRPKIKNHEELMEYLQEAQEYTRKELKKLEEAYKKYGSE